MQTRECSGCVVFRVVGGDLEFLLVKTLRSQQWGFPKGGVEPKLNVKESAMKEVKEEAGVNCSIVAHLGEYRFVKRDVIQRVVMFAAVYGGESAEWLERGKRERRWVKSREIGKILHQFLMPFAADVMHNATLIELGEAFDSITSEW
jgi:ADP-ribose pyrophosphatase YjhB (NUDIX family)